MVDANGIRIFEQEIKDAQTNIGNAKRSLTEVMARRMQADRKISELTKRISEHEGYAEKALAAGCDLYMSKPINIRELWARVESSLPRTP